MNTAMRRGGSRPKPRRLASHDRHSNARLAYPELIGPASLVVANHHTPHGWMCDPQVPRGEPNQSLAGDNSSFGLFRSVRGTDPQWKSD